MPSKPEFECKAIEGEPSFLLLARDPQFSILIDQWVAHREALIRCGVIDGSEQAKLDNAKVISASGAYWRKANPGLWKPRIADVTTSTVGDVTTVQVVHTNGKTAEQSTVTVPDDTTFQKDTRQAIEKSRIPSPTASVSVGFGPGITPMVPDKADIEITLPITAPVLNAIRSAAISGNVFIGTLLAFAHIESGFDPRAKASGGTAAGLYQFTHGTWTDAVTEFGVRLGVKADMIMDPRASSLIMAEVLKQYFVQLGRFGLVKDTGNAYCLHFLGMNGGMRLLRAATGQLGFNGQEKSGDLFPVAAMANESIFDKYPTVIQLYKHLHDHAEELAAAYTRMYAQPVTVVASA